MIINGRDIGFRNNPYAEARLKAERDKFAKRIGKDLKKDKLDEAEALEFAAITAEVLSDGEEKFRKVRDHDYVPNPLTRDEFLYTLDYETMSAIIEETRKEMNLKPEIEAKNAPGNGKKTKKSTSGGAKAGTDTSGK